MLVVNITVLLAALYLGYRLSLGGQLVDDNYYEMDQYDRGLILRNLKEKGVVVLRGYGTQIDTPRKFINLMRTFGVIDPVVSGTPLHLNQSTITRHYTRIINNEEGWHSDLSYLCNNPWISAVRAMGDNETVTEFRDMRKFYKKLPKVIKQGVSGMKTNHTDKNGTYCEHDVIHYVDNDRTIFANGAFTRAPIKPKDELMFNMLMWQLVNGTIYESFNVTWGKDDILMWDNNIVQHRENYQMEVHRVIVSDQKV